MSLCTWDIFNCREQKKKKNESFDKIKKRTFRTRRTRIFKNLNFNYLKRSSQQMVYAYAFLQI